MTFRNLKPKEKAVIEAMIDDAGSQWSHLKLNLNEIMVSEMSDGGMGSLLFQSNLEKRHLGDRICSAEFHDSDGVLVSLVLNVDEDGCLFELDSWKVNFDALIAWPDASQLKFVAFGG